MIEEIDTTSPTYDFKIPDDRPLAALERMQLWAKAVPLICRAGDTPKTAEQAQEVREGWREAIPKHSWLLNRLAFDDEWPAGHDWCPPYQVPTFCKPGARYMRQSEIAKKRLRALGPSYQAHKARMEAEAE